MRYRGGDPGDERGHQHDLHSEMLEGQSAAGPLGIAVVAVADSVVALGQALRRKGLIALIEASQPFSVANLVMMVLEFPRLRRNSWELMHHVQPAAVSCLRAALEDVPEADAEQDACTMAQAAALASYAASRKTLPPEAMPPLLAMLSRCRAGIEADVAAAIWRQKAVSPHSAAGSAAHAASASEWSSMWVAPLATAMHAMTMLAKPTQADRQAPSDVISACVAAASTLVAHEGVRVSRDPCLNKEIGAAVLAPLLLALPDCVAQEQLLYSLGSCLAGTARRLLQPQDSGGPAPELAAALSRLATIAELEAAGGQHKTSAAMLAPGSAAWAPFRDAVCESLAAAAGWIGPQSPPVDGAAETALFLAACHLGTAAATLLQAAVAAPTAAASTAAASTAAVVAAVAAAASASGSRGVPQWDDVSLLLQALTRYLDSSPVVYATVLNTMAALGEAHRPCDPKQLVAGFRTAGAAVALAIEAILADDADAAASELVEAACDGCIALFGLAQKETVHSEWKQLRGRNTDRQALRAMQQAAELVAKLLHSRLGSAAVECLATCRASSCLTAAALAVFTRQPTPPGTVQTLRAVCRTLVLLFRASPVPEQRRTAEEWASVAADIREMLRLEPAGRRQLLEKAVQEVSAALHPQHQPAGKQHSASSTKPAAPRTQASAEAAMQALLAEEQEQSAAAAAPSKAALKRARKKAAAAAAAAQASAAGHLAAPAATLPSRPNQPAAAAAAAAAVSGGSAGSDARSPATGAPQQVQDNTAGGPAPADAASLWPAAATVTAAVAGLQALRLSDDCASNAASTGAEPWMVCPLTKAVMREPVVCTGDGETYEQAAIQQWLLQHNTSPVTGQALPAQRDLIPDFALRSLIQAACKH